MNNLAEMRQLEAEVRQLEESVAAEKSAADRTTRVSLAFAAVVTGIILAFLAVNYSRVRSELTPEKLNASLEKELQELGPAAMREFGTLGQDLLPIYAAECRRQLEKAWPEISRKLEAEIVHLGDNITTSVNGLLAASEKRVLGKTASTILRSYPELNDEAKQKELEMGLHEACDRALEKACVDFDGLISKDLNRVEQEVLKFDVSDTNESTVDLQKKFLHLWLQLLDEEITKI